MDQKLITFAVPCYNSAAYMRHCIETLLSAGEQAEIILVDDGSVKDETPAICDEYAAKYPTIVKAIHQENGGHGEGVNQGIRNATGLYYKVVDSDDWLDTEALKKVLARLAALVERHTAPDLMIWLGQGRDPGHLRRVRCQVPHHRQGHPSGERRPRRGREPGHPQRHGPVLQGGGQ